MSDYTVGIDVGQGDVGVEDRYIRPSAEYLDGSWLHTVAGKVEVATGYYATIYPYKPSPYFHGGTPWTFISTREWPWNKKEEKK